MNIKKVILSFVFLFSLGQPVSAVAISSETTTKTEPKTSTTSQAVDTSYPCRLKVTRPLQFTVNTTSDSVDACPGDGLCADSNGSCTLRAAIQEANALTGKDTIDLPQGTYVLNLQGAGEDAAATGDLDVRGDLVIFGTGRVITSIDASQLEDRIFDVSSVPNKGLTGFALSALTLSGGKAADTGGGGAILNAGNLILNDVSIDGNQAVNGSGGGIFNKTVATLNDVRMTNNAADYSGGAIWSDKILNLNRTTLQYNKSRASSGGAISILEQANLSEVTIAGNSAHLSGGGIDVSGVLTLTKSFVWGNSAGENGGAINLSDQRATKLDITNSTFGDNTALGYGGGLLLLSPNAKVSLNNVTLTKNVARYLRKLAGSGGGFFINPGGVQVTMKNTLIGKNFEGDFNGAKSDCGGAATFTSLGYNFFGVSTNCFFQKNSGDQLDIDPLLSDIHNNNGGATNTYALLQGSPALDKGSPSQLGSGGDSCEVTDQRGFARVGRCDVGAYEGQGN